MREPIRDHIQFMQDGQLRSLPTHERLRTSEDCNWAGVRFEHRLRSLRPPSGRVHAVNPHLLYALSGEADVRSTSRGVRRNVRFRPGATYFVSAYEETLHTHFSDKVEFLILELNSDRLGGLASMQTPLPLLRQEPVSDRRLTGLFECMMSEISNRSPSGVLFAQSLSLALMSYVFERYARESAPLTSLPPLGNQAIRLIQEFIVANLGREIRLEDLAALAGTTPEHLCRTFKRATGVTPYQYVIRCRISKAKELLARNRHAIAEVAFKVGFSSQSHFTMTFRTHVGASPREYALSLGRR
jgi:AraC family transcriptional regulator